MTLNANTTFFNESALKRLFEILKSAHTDSFAPKEPTYLELCRYPGERFEEICSRILGFFFQSKNPHGFGSLFLKALKNSLSGADFDYEEDVCFELEEKTEKGKRIDILITGEKFVICIENKIWANLYNDLDEYKKFVEAHFAGKKLLFVVLSPDGKCSQNWIPLKYDDFFKQIESGVHDYQGKENSFFHYLTDWIQTVRDKIMPISYPKEYENFIVKNCERIRILEDCRRELCSRGASAASELIDSFVDHNQEMDFDNFLASWKGKSRNIKNLKSYIDYIHYYRESERPLLCIRIKLHGPEQNKIENRVKSIKDDGYEYSVLKDPKYGLYATISRENNSAQDAESFVGESVLKVVKTLMGEENV